MVFQLSPRNRRLLHEGLRSPGRRLSHLKRLLARFLVFDDIAGAADSVVNGSEHKYFEKVMTTKEVKRINATIVTHGYIMSDRNLYVI